MQPPESMLSLYRTMLLIRQCEEQLARDHSRGLIHGACHTYVGQEAIATGVCSALTAEDVIFSTHRGHGHALAKGLPPVALISELFGRATGCSRGRGGSMHLFAPEIGLMGTSGIVGPCILQAAGAGYSFRLLKQNHVAVAFFGDGAVNNGAFHEGLNLASIWKLPVLFVCENNRYATEVPFAYSAGIASATARGAAYGIASVEIDGNDVLAVQRAAVEAVARARRGDGPTLLECLTYRTRAHAEGMGDFDYRTRAEVAEWRERCPIKRLRADLLSNHGATKAQLDAIAAEVAAEVAAADKAAQTAPYPEPLTTLNHVFSVPQPAPQPPPAAGSRVLNWVSATLEALGGEMAANERIFVLGEGIGARGGNFGTTTGLFQKYGAERLRDTPICERGFVGLACGAAMTGTRPIADMMFIDFLNDGFGEVVNQVAKIQYMSSGRVPMPLILRGIIGIGHSAATHHSGNYYSIYTQVPGLRVVVPSTPYDAKGLLTYALRGSDPVLFFEHRELIGIKGGVPFEPYEIKFGQARIARTGTDVTVVALAMMVHRALAAAETLATEGISVEVIDPRTVAPLDFDAIRASVAKTGRLLILDESFAPCGFGAEIAASIANVGFDDLDAPIRRLNGAFVPTPYSPPLEMAVVPQPDDILKAIRELTSE